MKGGNSLVSNLVNCDLCKTIVKSIQALIDHVIISSSLSLMVQLAVQSVEICIILNNLLWNLLSRPDSLEVTL